MPNPFDLAPGPQTYSEQKVFPYSHQEVYSIVADVASYCQFVPFCTGSRILDATTDSTGKVHLEAELTVGFPPFTESYVSNVTCTPNVSVEAVASSSTPLFTSLSTIWRFQPVPTRSADLSPSVSTLATMDLSYAFASPIHAAVSSSFFGKVSSMNVKAFQERCIQIYGRRV